MANSSFEDISTHNWGPASTYQALQTLIQNEVNQGLWANQAQPQGWCSIATSAPHGVNNSWVTHTYQQINNPTQTSVVVWPAGWPAPAENIHGELPAHFFASASTTSHGAVDASIAEPLSQTSAAPTTPPTYKPTGQCV